MTLSSKILFFNLAQHSSKPVAAFDFKTSSQHSNPSLLWAEFSKLNRHLLVFVSQCGQVGLADISSLKVRLSPQFNAGHQYQDFGHHIRHSLTHTPLSGSKLIHHDNYTVPFLDLLFFMMMIQALGFEKNIACQAYACDDIKLTLVINFYVFKSSLLPNSSSIYHPRSSFMPPLSIQTVANSFYFSPMAN